MIANVDLHLFMLAMIVNVGTLMSQSVETGEGSPIPSNAMLYEDGSPMLYEDGSFMLYEG